MRQGDSGGGVVVYVDELLSVCEVGFEPGKSGTSDVEGCLETGQEDGVTDGVESCTEVKEDEYTEVAGVCGVEEVIGDFKEGGFGAVFKAESRLERFV